MSECGSCGVAFDSGKRSCSETSCPSRSTRHKYVYPPRAKEYGRLTSIKSRARKKGVSFGLTLEFLLELLQMPCVYCGAEESIEVDRKNSLLGYTTDNVVSACHRCNTLKNNVVSFEEMVFIASYLGWGWQVNKRNGGLYHE